MDYHEGFVMRGVLYLVVGLLLGANCVLAFAAIEPDDIVVRRTGGGISVIKPYNPSWSGGAGGSATSTATGVMDIAGRGVGVATSKTIPGTGLAAIGRGVARLGGPLAIGLSLAPLVWDELQLWVSEDGNDMAGGYYPTVQWGSVSSNWGQPDPTSALNAAYPDWTGPVYTENQQWIRVAGVWYYVWLKDYRPGQPGPLTKTVVPWAVCTNGGTVQDGPDGKRCSSPGPCGAGFYRHETTGQCVAARRVATDSEVESAILEEISSSPYSAKTLAEYLELAGKSSEMEARMGPGVASGPASVPGPTTTTTSSGPAGQTTTVTNVTNNLTYNNNTVTVTTTTTSVTTHPDNSTTSETTTQEPPTSEGAVAEVPPAEDQPSLCEEFPQASGCQPLGEVADQQIGQADRSIPGLSAGSVGGACPAPLVFSPGIGGTYLLEWDPVCDAAGTFRPAVIGMAWLGAGIWLFLIARGAA